jgi:integrase
VRKNKEEPREYYAEADVWDAVYAAGCEDLRNAMDLSCLTAQRPADVRKVKRGDIQCDALKVTQGKTKKILRIRLTSGGLRTGLGMCIDRLLVRAQACKSGHLICTEDGAPLTAKMLRGRYDKALAAAAAAAEANDNADLAERIKQFQFRNIRPKAGSEIESLAGASELMGHTNQAITKRVYRRKGEVVNPTK